MGWLERWRSRIPVVLLGVALALVVHPCVAVGGEPRLDQTDSRLVDAKEPFRYPENRYGKGELRYIDGIPVLIVRGSHAEMGEQIGHLALKPAAKMFELLNAFVDRKVPKSARPLVDMASQAMYAKFPREYQEELEAMAAAGDVDTSTLIMANTIIDLFEMVGCASLLVDQERTTTGGPLYGRNLDVYSIEGLAEFSLLMVHCPNEGHGSAMPNFPGFLMMGSGMNSRGLAMGSQSVAPPKDGSGRFNPAGVSSAVAGRRLMECCADVDEARAWLDKNRLARCVGLAACDREHQAVLEVTTKRVLTRSPTEGICCATNHFRHPDLAENVQCRRYTVLDASRKMDRLGVGDVAELMKTANQGKATVHTMVFEPAKLQIHLAMGSPPATDHPLVVIGLAEWFASRSPDEDTQGCPAIGSEKAVGAEKKPEPSVPTWEQVSADEAQLPPMTVADLLREYDKGAAAGKKLRSWEARCRVTSKRQIVEQRRGALMLFAAKEPKYDATTHTILLGACGERWFSERRDGEWKDENVEHRTYCDGEHLQVLRPCDKSISILPQADDAAAISGSTPPRPALPVGFPPFLEEVRQNYYPIPEVLPEARESLADPAAKVLPWRTRVDGRVCYVVEQVTVREQPLFRSVEELNAYQQDHPDREVLRVVNPKAKPGDKRIDTLTTRLALDPASGFMPARWTHLHEVRVMQDADLSEFGPTSNAAEDNVCGNFRKFGDGGYVAGRFRYTHHVSNRQGKTTLLANRDVVLEEFQVDREYSVWMRDLAKKKNQKQRDVKAKPLVEKPKRPEGKDNP